MEMNAEIKSFLQSMLDGEPVRSGTKASLHLNSLAQEAIRICDKINSAYNTPEEIQELFAELTGQPVNRTFRMFPPFTADCGKNIFVGNNVFFNSGCRLQDQGGIYIGDGALIGHNVVIATLNHGMSPEERHDLFPAPVHIGKNAWIGAGAVIVPGVTIGDNAVIGAGSVVTKDIPANAVAVGSPARVVREG